MVVLNKIRDRSFKKLIENINSSKFEFRVLTLSDILSLRLMLVVYNDLDSTRLSILLMLAKKDDHPYKLVIDLQRMLTLCINNDHFDAAKKWVALTECLTQEKLLTIGSIHAFNYVPATDDDTCTAAAHDFHSEAYKQEAINNIIATYTYSGMLMDEAISTIKKEYLWEK